jgi:hypothetical protein
MTSRLCSFITLYKVPLTYSLCFLLFLTTVLSRLLFNGMIFEFDYHLYQPDGAVYSYMALKYAGFSHIEAAQRVINWYSLNAEPGTSLNLSFFSLETNPGVWSLGSSRILYPLLSAPFVHQFGVSAMLVIPILSLFLLLFIIVRIAHRLDRLLLGSILIFFLTLSPTVTRWFVANITDGLLTAIIGLAFYLALTFDSKVVWIPLIILVILGSATRFSAPYWIVFSIMYWFIHKKTSILLLLATIVGVTPTLLAKPDSGSIVVGAGSGVIEKLLYFPISALRVLFIEFTQLAAIDRSLLAILISATLISVINLRRQSSQLFLLMAFAGWFIGALNGVLGVNFRYQLPVIVFACWVILDQAEILRNRPIRDTLKIMRYKAK